MPTSSLLSVVLFTTLAMAGSSAHAATPAAWASHDKTLLAKCLQASQLKNPQAAGSPALFDDRVGYTALLLKGTYPQKFMNGRSGTELCLYRRANQSAVVTEWDGVSTPKKP